MNTSVDINRILELIDLYKYASVAGERVEIIVTPYENEGKWDDSKRVITIGLQGGLSRDRDTFVIENVEDFDQYILPQIIAYYSEDDTLSKWDVVVPDVPGTTAKGVAETESGNLFYLESLDENIYENLTQGKKEVEEKTTYKKTPLTDEEKIWDEIILYAKKRRIAQDFYKGASFTSEEQQTLYNFIVNVINEEKNISIGNARKYKEKNEKLFEELFKDKDRLISLGLNEELIDKVVKSGAVKHLASLAATEKRVRRRLDLENPEIQSKIEFATSELEKVEYFNLRNASAIQFEDGVFRASQPKAVRELKETYDESSSYPEEVREKYRSYCDEILSYLEKKARNNRKIVQTEATTPKVEFEPLNNSVVDSFEKLREAIDLVRYGKLDEEHYEIIVEPDSKDASKRLVRISLTDGVSRGDTFNFEFTNGELFDEEFSKILEEIRKEDPNIMSEVTFIDIPGKELKKTALHSSQQGNEILIKSANDTLAYPKSAKIIEEEPKGPDSGNGNAESDNNQGQTNEEEKIGPTGPNDDLSDGNTESDNNQGQTSEDEEIEPTGPNVDLSDDMLAQLLNLEKEINDEARRQDEELESQKQEEKNEEKREIIDTTESFDKMHEYVQTYEIGNSKGPLQIFYRDAGREYTPESEEEKRNIEFAIFWSVMAGIDESPDDVVVGEKYAFSEESKKLFDIMDVHFKESIKRGIDVDFESLHEQFMSSGVKNADKVYDRLFKNQFYIDYITLYYKKALEIVEPTKGNSTPSDNENKKDLATVRREAEEQARELQAKNEEADLIMGAEEQAEELMVQNERNELLSNAYKLAKKMLEKKQEEEIIESADIEAQMIQRRQEKAELIKGAKEQARQIQEKEEQEEIKEGAKKQAEELNSVDQNEEIRKGAQEQAIELQNGNTLAEIIHDAKNQAKELQSKNEQEELKEGAKEQAKELQSIDEDKEIKKGAVETAHKIQEKVEKEELKKGAEQQAKELQSIDQDKEIKKGAVETARKIQEEVELKEGAEEQARELQSIDEDKEIKKGAMETARKIHEEQVELEKGAEEQAKLLTDSKEDALFEIVTRQEEKEMDPELVEIQDAFEVVESYATAEQPTSIKIFFDKENPGYAEVIISNGVGVDEAVMYQRTFDEEKLKQEIIPLLCRLYANGNEITYNMAFDVPNTSKAGLVVVGTDEKTFQVSNAEKTIVKICEDMLYRELANNTSKESNLTK